jgi:hypothetical protein
VSPGRGGLGAETPPRVSRGQLVAYFFFITFNNSGGTCTVGIVWDEHFWPQIIDALRALHSDQSSLLDFVYMLLS